MVAKPGHCRVSRGGAEDGYVLPDHCQRFVDCIDVLMDQVFANEFELLVVEKRTIRRERARAEAKDPL